MFGQIASIRYDLKADDAKRLLLLSFLFFWQIYFRCFVLGGLFHVRDNLLEIAFINAVEHNSRGVLGRRLVAQTRKVPEHDSFQVSQTVCDLLRDGVAGIFGPPAPETAIHVQSICDAKEIPHVEIKWNHYQKNKLRSLNIYPHPLSLSQALVDVVKMWHWKTFTLLYQVSTNKYPFHLWSLRHKLT